MLSLEKRPTMEPIPPTADHHPLDAAASNLQSNGTSNGQPKTQHHHLWLVTGPAGCGKSSVAQFIAKTMNLPYMEGDEFHTPANIEKMSKGIPLTDADRWDWLTRLRDESIQRLSEGSQGVVLTCSALKRKYRDVIRVAPYYDHDIRLHFIYLHAEEEVLLKRVQQRQGHYMGANMVHSQFSILQPPAKEETDVITVDVSRSLKEVEEEAIAKIHEAIQKELQRDS